MAKSIQEYFDNQTKWKTEAQILRKYCLNTVLKEELKWGAPCYTLDGKHIVGIASFNSYVGLWFHQGVFLQDKQQLLEQSSDQTKGLRKMTFSALDELLANQKHIEDYIAEAILNANKGLEIEIERHKQIDIPVMISTAMNKNQELKTAFENLSTGKQRAYCEFITSAKQNKTKQNRLNKIIPMILQGIGLHDKYK